MPGDKGSVGGEADLIGIAEARSALSWWLDAGVDCALQEEARNWLKPSERPRIVEAATPPNVTQPSHETLSELKEWLASSAHLPLASASARRILPHGPELAAIMLLSDAPALEDYTAGQPIGGEAWELTKKMLQAIGLRPDEAYSASLSPMHAPGSRLTPKDREEYAKIARQHIRLAAPKRLVLFGDGPSQALLGKRLVDARGRAHKIEDVRAVATFHPRHLIKRPLDKSLAWQDLLLLMEDET